MNPFAKSAKALALVTSMLAISCAGLAKRFENNDAGCPEARTAVLTELKSPGADAAVSVNGRWKCVDESVGIQEIWNISQTDNRVTMVVMSSDGGNASFSGSVIGSELLYTNSISTVGGRLQIDGGSMKGWVGFESGDSACQKDVLTCVRYTEAL